MDTELLSLKWNNHKNTFLGIVKLLRNKISYSDTTLACEGKFYQVHKIVLSVCSDYFTEIFENTPCKNPVIVLKDISHRSLEFLLDYMYLGEVNVKQSELAVLIKAAECLQIKGLAAPDEEQVNNIDNKKTNLLDGDEPLPKRRKKRHTQSSIESEQSSQQLFTPITIDDPVPVEVKSEPVDEMHTENNDTTLVKKTEDSISIDKVDVDYSSSFNEYDPGPSGVGKEPEENWQDYNFEDDNSISADLDPDLSGDPSDAYFPQQYATSGEKFHTGGKLHHCAYCKYSSSQIGNWRKHTRTHTGEKPYTCDYCDFKASDKSSIYKHTRNHTKQQPLKCAKCEFSTFSQNKFRNHEIWEAKKQTYN